MELPIVQSLIKEAQNAYLKRELSTALEFTEKAHDFAHQIDYQEGIQTTQFLKGEVLTTKAVYSCEEENYQDALTYCLALDMNLPFTYILLGQLYTHHQEFDQAWKVLNKAGDMTRDVESERDNYVLSVVYLGYWYYEQHQVGKVDGIINSLKEVIEEQNYFINKLVLNKALQFIVEIKSHHQEIELMEINAKELLGKSSLLQDQESKLISIRTLCLVYIIKTDYRLAMRYSMLTINLGEKISYEKLIILGNYDLASIYKNLKNYNKGKEILERILSKYGSKIHEKRKLRIHVNLAIIFTGLNLYYEAVNHYEKALKISQKSQNNRDTTFILCGLCSLYLEYLKDIPKSKFYYNAFQKSFQNISSRTQKIIFRTYVSFYAYLLNDFTKAEPLLKKSLNECSELKHFKLVNRVCLQLYEINKQKEDYQQALHYHELYHKSQIKILKEAKKRETLNLEFKYQTKEKEKEIELLKTQMEYKELELNQKISDLYLQALQSQMNPHFIFNALNGIQKFITSGESEQAMIYLARFAKLIRMIFEQSKREQITLEEEVEFLGLYLQLEKFRFQDKVTIDFQVDEDLIQEEIYMSPLLIQPIIENAFKHGLMHKETEGHLKVTIELVDDHFIKCVVEDNGVGRAKAKQLSQWKIKGQQSSGLKTTEKRLAIINQKESVNLNIIDLKDTIGNALGTRIEMLIKAKVLD